MLISDASEQVLQIHTIYQRRHNYIIIMCFYNKNYSSEKYIKQIGIKSR